MAIIILRIIFYIVPINQLETFEYYLICLWLLLKIEINTAGARIFEILA